MKKFLVIALLSFAFQLQAQVRIGDTEAYATAKLFMQQQAKKPNISLSLNEVIGSKDSGQANLFVFTMNPRGFVIVSATNEVLAYSLVNVFPTSNELPDHIAYWLDLYNDQTDYLLQHPDQQKVPSKSQNAVEPLLTSCWGQGCFHNEACPEEENGPCGHVSAGCVAIAMAQIMYCQKWPMSGSGTYTYSCPPYGKLSADFNQTSYHWEKMADTLHESNLAVAELVYHCGVSVKMQYGAHLSLASRTDALDAFQKYFYYPDAASAYRTKYSDEEWIEMITEELDSQRPILYFGKSNLGGHAFVCDGYDGNGLFHFNFGWDGVADGYYTLDTPYGFSVNQSVIRNLKPLPVTHMKASICEGETYLFFDKPLKRAGFYTTIDNNEFFELDLNVLPLPELHCCKDTLVDYGQPFLLKVVGADSYLWSTGDTTASPTILPLESQTYSVTGFSKEHCSTTAYINVKVRTDKGEMVVCPNPANDKVIISMPLIDEVEILNLFGQPIDHVDAHREAVEIDVSRYVNGVYIVHVREMSKHSYKKLIVRH